MKRIALWALLVEQGFFDDKSEASRWILSGAVYCDGMPVDKVGARVPRDCTIRIKGLDRAYVSRGGSKLEIALKEFEVHVADTVALDAGASTGGFTDCLLKHGARLVYAVDVGYGQLHGSLRADHRVSVYERTNLSDEVLRELDPSPELVTLDLSYLSLTRALPLVASIMPEGVVVALFKPLFEVEDNRSRREGTDPTDNAVRDAVVRVMDAGAEVHLRACGVAASPVRGSRGTRELFLAFVAGNPVGVMAECPEVAEDDIAIAIEKSHERPPPGRLLFRALCSVDSRRRGSAFYPSCETLARLIGCRVGWYGLPWCTMILSFGRSRSYEERA